MDLDGDGTRDMLTGCWPGELHFFRGKVGGGFEASTHLAFADGKPIVLESASTVFATDWEQDGDLDLLVGDIQGKVRLVPNASGTKELKFEAAQPVRAGGKDLEVSGDSAPIVADWDVDGRSDLIVGSGDGSVTWYRNLAAEGAPLLSAAVALLPAERGHMAYRVDPSPAKPQAPSPGGRTKVAVADWDEDGRLDLLVGDFGSDVKEAPELTPEQAKRRDELQAEQQTLTNEFSAAYRKALREAAKAEGVEIPEGQEYEPGDDKALQKKINDRAIASLGGEASYMDKYQKRMQAIFAELGPLQPQHEMRGNVWFFARTVGGELARLAPPSAPSAVPAAPSAPLRCR